MKSLTIAFERPRLPAGLRPFDVLSAFFAFAGSLSVFLFSLAPTITFGDSGELITAAVRLGVAHPPGYPLWLIVAKFFSLLPIGTVAYRLNLMSAMLDALAVGILALAISRTLPNVCGRMVPRESFDSPVVGMLAGSASATAALCLAFSPTFWQQSLIAEVYALNNLLVCLILLLLVLWSEEPRRNGLLFGASFILGLGLGNHQTLVLMAPAFAAYVLLMEPRTILSPKAIGGCVALFLLGLCIYLYLPIRASANPPLNWGDPDSWSSFLFHVLRKQYRSIDLIRPLAIIGSQVKFFFSSIGDESLPIVLLLPALLTFGFASKEGKIWLLFTLTAFVCMGVLLVVVANTELDLNAQDLLKIYFLPALIIVAMWIGYGIATVSLLALRASRRLRRNAIAASALAALWLLMPIVNLTANYQSAGMRGHDFGLLYGQTLINGLRGGAVLLAGTDSAYSIPMYMKWVEGRRPDISIISVNRLSDQNYAAEAKTNAPGLEFLTPRDYVDAFSLQAPILAGGNGGVYGSRRVAELNAYLLLKLYQRNIAERPIYYDEGLPIEWISDFAIPSGLVMELKQRRIESLPGEVVASDTQYWHSLEELLLGNTDFLNDTAARQKFSKCRSNIGALYLRRKMYPEAEAAFQQAIRFSDRNIEAYALLALALKQQGRQEEAVRVFEEYLRRDPWNTSAREFALSLKG